MGLLSLLEVASMPNIQVLLICLLGAFLSTDRCNILPPHARTSLNKVINHELRINLMINVTNHLYLCL